MQIDWFTFFAQILNFLILIVLLRRFLYGPITRAMHDREARLAARFAEADAQTRQAQQEGELFRVQRREFEDKRDELLAEARAEAAALRKAMLQEVRQDVEAQRRQWVEAVASERQAILQELRSRVGEQVMVAARNALAHLAQADLEQSIIATFLGQLQQLAPQARRAPTDDDPAGSEQVVVRSTFALPDAVRRRVIKALQVHYPATADDSPTQMSFELADDLICGVEVQVRDRRLGWNVRDYLQSLEDTLDHALLTEAPALQHFAPPSNKRGDEGLFLA